MQGLDKLSWKHMVDEWKAGLDDQAIKWLKFYM